ncbi:MAG: ROK family protein [Candidatus Aminicenantes bacterium]|nr:ROK family protein [Candidatus Aminicenantes bacterium]
MSPKVFAGFDLGGTNLKYGLVAESGEVLEKSSAPTPKTFSGVLDVIASVWNELRRRTKNRPAAAGFGFPGIYSRVDRRILQSPNCPSLDNVDLEAALERLLNVPFRVDNDANMAAYGEWRCGAGRGVSSMVHLTIGTGIGSGIILDGSLWRGRCGFAGELGHITVNPEGDRCACGNQGCLETEAAAPKIVRNYKDLSKTKRAVTAEDVFEKAARGEVAAIKAFGIAGTYLGIALGIVINMLNPEKIVLGGGVMTTGDFLLPPAVEEAARRSYRASFACCSIEKALLGNDAGLIGAALRAGAKE